MENYVCKFMGAKVLGLNWFTTLLFCFFKKNLKKNAQLLRATHLSKKNHFLFIIIITVSVL